MPQQTDELETPNSLEERFRAFQSRAAKDYEDFAGRRYPLRTPKGKIVIIDLRQMFQSWVSHRKVKG